MAQDFNKYLLKIPAQLEAEKKKNADEQAKVNAQFATGKVLGDKTPVMLQGVGDAAASRKAQEQKKPEFPKVQSVQEQMKAAGLTQKSDATAWATDMIAQKAAQKAEVKTMNIETGRVEKQKAEDIKKDWAEAGEQAKREQLYYENSEQYKMQMSQAADVDAMEQAANGMFDKTNPEVAAAYKSGIESVQKKYWGQIESQYGKAEQERIVKKYGAEKGWTKQMQQEYAAAMEKHMTPEMQEQMQQEIEGLQSTKKYIQANQAFRQQDKTYMAKAKEFEQKAVMNSLAGQNKQNASARAEAQKELERLKARGVNVTTMSSNSHMPISQRDKDAYLAAAGSLTCLAAADDLNEKSAKLIDAANKKSGFWKATAATASDWDTWSMGVTELFRSLNLKEVLGKVEKNPEVQLTKGEQALVDAYVINAAANGLFGDQLSTWYKAGQTTVASLPFIAQFIMLNPSGIASAGARKMMGALAKNISKRYGLSLVRKGLASYGGRVLVDTLAKGAVAAGMTATVGMPKVMADYENKRIGQVQYKIEDGDVKYNGTFHPDTTELQDFASAFNSNMQEYASELLLDDVNFGRLFGLQKPLSKAVSWFNKTDFGKFMGKIVNEGGIKMMRDITKRASFSGFVGENAEEVLGSALTNAVDSLIYPNDEDLVNPDGTIRDRWADMKKMDTYIETAAGLLPMSVVFGLLGLGGSLYVENAAKRNYRQMYQMSNEIERTQLNALYQLGFEADENSLRESMITTLRSGMPDEEKKKSLMSLMAGYADALQGEAIRQTGVGIADAQEMSEEDALDNQTMQDTQKALADATARVSVAFAERNEDGTVKVAQDGVQSKFKLEQLGALSKEGRMAWLKGVLDSEEYTTYQKTAAVDFVRLANTVDQVTAARQKDLQNRVQQFREEVEGNVESGLNQNTQTVVEATMDVDGKPTNVRITAGAVLKETTDEQGNKVYELDKENSDDNIYYTVEGSEKRMSVPVGQVQVSDIMSMQADEYVEALVGQYAKMMEATEQQTQEEMQPMLAQTAQEAMQKYASEQPNTAATETVEGQPNTADAETKETELNPGLEYEDEGLMIEDEGLMIEDEEPVMENGRKVRPRSGVYELPSGERVKLTRMGDGRMMISYTNGRRETFVSDNYVAKRIKEGAIKATGEQSLFGYNDEQMARSWVKEYGKNAKKALANTVKNINKVLAEQEQTLQEKIGRYKAEKDKLDEMGEPITPDEEKRYKAQKPRVTKAKNEMTAAADAYRATGMRAERLESIGRGMGIEIGVAERKNIEEMMEQGGYDGRYSLEREARGERREAEGESGEAGLVDNAAATTFGEDIREKIDKIAKKLGKTIEFVYDPNGANGDIDLDKNKIRVNLASTKSMWETLGHELFHGMRAEKRANALKQMAAELGEQGVQELRAATEAAMREEAADNEWMQNQINAATIDERMTTEWEKTHDGEVSDLDRMMQILGDLYGEEQIAAVMARKAKLYAAAYKRMGMNTFSQTMIEEEVLADFAGELFTNPEMVDRLLKDSRCTPALVKKLMKFIDNVVDGFKDLFGTEDQAKMREARKILGDWYEETRPTAKRMDKQVGRSIDEATTGAIEGDGTTASERLSISEGFAGAGVDSFRTVMESDKYGNPVEVRQPLVGVSGNMEVEIDGKRYDGKHAISGEDLAKNPNTALNMMLQDAVDSRTISQGKAQQIREKYASILNRVLQAGLKENGGPEHAMQQWMWLGETVYKTVASNGDKQYSWSIDITRVCKKNEAIIRAISEMQKQTGYGITPGQILDLYTTAFENDYQVPCPVCYVFSRYIRNGKYASAAINGMIKYGEHLPGGSGKLWTAKQWAAEYERLKGEGYADEDETNEEQKKQYAKLKADAKAKAKEVSAANTIVTEVLSKIDELGKKYIAGTMDDMMRAEYEKRLEEIDRLLAETDETEVDVRRRLESERIDVNTILQGEKLSAKEKKEIIDQVKALDKQYRDALKIVSQQSLTNWIKCFAINYKKGGKSTMRDDARYPENMEEFVEMSLDLRETAKAMKYYPAIQRLRKSGGAAAGKEITFESNNELGEIICELGGPAENYYKLAAEAARTGQPQQVGGKTMSYEKLREAAKKKFEKSRKYVLRQNLRGGQRMWSWSDNIETLAPDVAWNLMQLEMLGGTLQSYSKQLEGIDLVASMNGYVNGSLMGKGKGWRDVADSEIAVDESGKEYVKDLDLAFTGRDGEHVVLHAPVYEYTDKEGNTRKITLDFDDVVGIDAFGKTDKSGKHYKGLFELNWTLDKAGNIIVGMNDAHVLASMADPRIFFIIPWHASGANNHVLQQMYNVLGVELLKKNGGAQDYTDVQEEKDLAKGNVTVKEGVRNFWKTHDYSDQYKCGIGVIESGDGGKGLSKGQREYRKMRNKIFDGTYTAADLRKIRADEFLSQVLDSVLGTEENPGPGTMENADKGFIYPYEYWNKTTRIEEADENARRYMEYCRRLGFKPKFVGKLDGKPERDHGNFMDEPGAWKLLIDRRMYDVEGNYQHLDQTSSETFDADLIDPEVTKDKYVVTRVADNEGVQRIVEQALQKEESRMFAKQEAATVDFWKMNRKDKPEWAEKYGKRFSLNEGEGLLDFAKRVDAEEVDDEVDEVNANRFSLDESAAMREFYESGMTLNDPELLDEYGLESFELVMKSGGYAVVSMIKAKEQGNGAGTRMMNDLTAWADKNGVKLALTPDDGFGATSEERLKKFYKRFGFVENKGRNTDFSTRESMIRKPKDNGGNGGKRFSLDEKQTNGMREGESIEEFAKRIADEEKQAVWKPVKGQTSAEQLKDYQAWRMAHAEDNPLAAAKAAREVVTTLNGISALTQNYRNGAADMHKFTVEEAASLQNMIQAMRRHGIFDHTNASEMDRLMGEINRTMAAGVMGDQEQLQRHVQNVVDKINRALADSYLVNMRRLLTAATKTRTNDKGVEVIGLVDVRTKNGLKEVLHVMSLAETSTLKLQADIKMIEDRLATEKMTDESARMLEDKRDGLQIALNLIGPVRNSEAAIRSIREEMKAVRHNTAIPKWQKQERLAALQAEISDERGQMAVHLANAYASLKGIVNEGREGKRNWIQQQKDKRRRIATMVSRDMAGVKKPIQKRDESEKWKDTVQNFAGVTLRSLNSLLKHIGRHSIDGRGYLYDHFMPAVIEANTQASNQFKAWRKKLDEAAQEYVGKSYAEVIREITTKDLGTTISWKNYSQKRNENGDGLYEDEIGNLFVREEDGRFCYADRVTMEPAIDSSTGEKIYATDKDTNIVPIWEENGQMEELKVGEALYLIMLNRMTDGRTKLKAMDITDKNIEDLEAKVREVAGDGLMKLADYLQEKFLHETWEVSNATHERVFGASMADIENYVPLKIDKHDLTKKVDVSDDLTREDAKPSTIVGSLIQRTRNSHTIQVLGSDALDIIEKHLQEMAHWNAWAELNQEANMLLSNKEFRNKMESMGGLYGSGKKMFEEFMDAYAIASGNYKARKTEADKFIANAGKLVTASKISFRMMTALKQILSLPAFFAEGDAYFYGRLMNNLNPYNMFENWMWCKENLPLLRDRWDDRMSGDVRSYLDEQMMMGGWKNPIGMVNRYTKNLQRWGMTPNALVDMLTCCVGAKSKYESSLHKYKEWGYTEEEAKRKARIDAEICYNESQQSAIGGFLSTVQRDRTMVSMLISLFNNSAIGYQRRLVESVENLKKLRKEGRSVLRTEYADKLMKQGTPRFKADAAAEDKLLFSPKSELMAGYKRMLKFETKKLMDDGLTKEQAEKAAEKKVRQGIAADIAGVITFGYVVSAVWRLGGNFAYLLFGDDDDEKKEMVQEAINPLYMSEESMVGNGIWVAPVRGLPGGATLETLLDNGNTDADLPFVSDLQNAAKHSMKAISSKRDGNGWEDSLSYVIPDLISLMSSLGVGVDLKVASEMVYGLMDSFKDHDDAERTLNRLQLDLARILNAPKSQQKKLIIDCMGEKTWVDLKRGWAEQAVRDYMEFRHQQNYGLLAPIVGPVSRMQKTYWNDLSDEFKVPKEYRKSHEEFEQMKEKMKEIPEYKNKKKFEEWFENQNLFEEGLDAMRAKRQISNMKAMINRMTEWSMGVNEKRNIYSREEANKLYRNAFEAEKIAVDAWNHRDDVEYVRDCREAVRELLRDAKDDTERVRDHEEGI